MGPDVNSWAEMAATAIIVPVNEAEPHFFRWRRHFTQDGADGLPSHVTLLYPFVDEAQLVAKQIGEVRERLSRFPAFEFALTRLAEEPVDGVPVLYAEVEPSDPFERMTEALVHAFPTYPPYGGKEASIPTHVTLAHHPDAPLFDIRDAVAATLPLAARAEQVCVMSTGRDGWRLKSRIDLANASESVVGR